MKAMEWLNYHHLLYFWVVGRTGSVTAASKELRLAGPTLSTQIRRLEEQFGEKLLQRSGRRLILTDVGKMVMGYAEDIFALGKELMDSIKDRPTGRPLRLSVGVADVVPKWIAYRLLEPALHLPERVQIHCREDRPERLLLELASHDLDVMISDSPIGLESNVRVFNHLLGECGTSFFAKPKVARRYVRGFPRSLHGAPFLLPSRNTALRKTMDEWFNSLGIQPSVVGEFDDFALIRTFAEEGQGILSAPSALDQEMREHYRFQLLGRTQAVHARYYAISVERKIKHPAVVAIADLGRQNLFSRPQRRRPVIAA